MKSEKIVLSITSDGKKALSVWIGLKVVKTDIAVFIRVVNAIFTILRYLMGSCYKFNKILEQQ